MKIALVNPAWTFQGSIYFGCREPHFPLELAYSRALLEKNGHEVMLADGHLEGLSNLELAARMAEFRPDISVVPTAPTYLFWRCAPPELAIPKALIRDIRDVAGTVVAVGPHGSTTPRAALEKLGADAVVAGECEEVLARLNEPWETLPSLCYRRDGIARMPQARHSADMAALPALRWPDRMVDAHRHHHHRFDAEPGRPGAEMEASRGCPYHCTFCAKDNFRDRYRRRPVSVVLQELDHLLAQGVEYVYFIDEIFLPNRELLLGLAERRAHAGLAIGIQTRIDLWSLEMIDMLADAGCRSIEAGVESLTPQGRDLLAKQCKLSTKELSDRLIYAKRRIAFVQANLISSDTDEPAMIANWRERMRGHGVWANDPVPMFPYPGSPDYTLRWGAPDDLAWERAHEYYLSVYSQFSEIQEQQPAPLVQLENV